MPGQELGGRDLLPVEPATKVGGQLEFSPSRRSAKAPGVQLIGIELDVAAQRALLHPFDRTDVFEEPVHLSLIQRCVSTKRLEWSRGQVNDHDFGVEGSLPGSPPCLLTGIGNGHRSTDEPELRHQDYAVRPDPNAAENRPPSIPLGIVRRSA